MKRYSILLLVAAALLLYCFSCRPAMPPEKKLADGIIRQTDSLQKQIKELAASFDHPGTDSLLQSRFLATRLAYKSIEWAAEYFVPTSARTLNGPPVKEVELSGAVIEPAGLQVIEGDLFPKVLYDKKDEIIRQCQLMDNACTVLKNHLTGIPILDWQVFDAAKLEVFRVITVGLNGFDDPLSLRCFDESAASLQSVREGMSQMNQTKGSPLLDDLFGSAIGNLKSASNFASFNRLYFIKSFANPLSSEISDLELSLHVQVTRYNRLLNQDAQTLFDSNAFNVNAYVPDYRSFASPEKIILGKKLFADPMLSQNGVRSCQSCHQPEKAFTDGLTKNTIIGKQGLLARNTPTLINAALQPALFYDLRVPTLEAQSVSVVQSAEEMHGSMKLSGKRLWQDTMYKRMFSAAFPSAGKSGIDTFEIMNAIGSYVRSLTLLNSRFDEYMRGKATALTADEISGANLFMGKARCGTCHYMPLFNGNFPPRFIKSDAEVIGVPGDTAVHAIDPDPGQFGINKVAAFYHAFKTPTLRNAARTAPYMHNGIYGSLEQVMRFYNEGGGQGKGLKLDNQTLPADSLHLSIREQQDIISFIKALDSKYD